MSEPATRIRARFTKGEEVRFISHLDLAHAMERAARRARLPLVFSEGFHPMPKISFAAALAVGATSEAEYVDMDLQGRFAPEEFRERLNAVLPRGLEIRESAVMPLEAKSLQAVVNLAAYQVRPVFADEVTGREVAEEIARLMASPSLITERGSGRGEAKAKTMDIRPFLAQCEVAPSLDGLTLLVSIRMGPQGSAKPEEYLRHLPWALQRVRVHRTGIYVQRDTAKLSPLQVVR